MNVNELKRQSGVIAGIVSCFMLLSIISPCSINKAGLLYIGITGALFITFAALFAGYIKEHLFLRNHNKDFWKKNQYLLLFFVGFVTLRLLQFDILPRWDSDIYFAQIKNACDNFDFTIFSFINSFKLAGHISYGYSLFLAIGYYICPNGFTGVYLMNLLLSAVAFFMTFRILVHYIPRADRRLVAFGTFIIWCQPMNLGLFHKIVPDYELFIFLIYVLYFHIYKKYLLLCFFSVILMTTKETGIICVAGYCLGYILCVFYGTGKKGFERVKAVLKNKIVLSMIFAGIAGMLAMLYLMFVSRTLWGVGYGQEWYGVPFSRFAFQKGYIVQKLKTFFLLNFYWLWLLIIIICSIALLKKKRDLIIISFHRYPELICFIGALLAHIVFSVLYVTYNIPRYNLCVEFGLALFGVLLLFVVFKEKHLCAVETILGLVFVLIFLQTYLTIDPITKMVFPIASNGSSFPMVNVQWKETPSLKSETTVYNYQYTYLDKAYDQLLRDINYNGDVDLILWGPMGVTVDAVDIDGLFLHYYWDTEKQERTMNENEHTVPINRIFQEEFEDELYENGLLHEKAVWIFTPHFEDNEVELYSELDEYYHIDETRQEAGGSYGGKVYYYMMQLR